MKVAHADQQTISALVQGHAATSRATDLSKLTSPQRPAERAVVGRGHVAGALLSCALLARDLDMSDERFLELALEVLEAVRTSSDPLAALTHSLLSSLRGP